MRLSAYWLIGCQRNRAGKIRSQINLFPNPMINLLQFRRCTLLLLSLTLSAQAMAVASLGSCHRMKAMMALHQMVTPDAHHHADSAEHHDGSMHHADGNGKAPTNDDARGGCAACAACHLSSVILNTEHPVADVPLPGGTTFPHTDVPRARNVASGLERPPRA